MKRTTKFYRKNEKEVMKNLGLTPSPSSGSGWLIKCDGYNDKIICELKSTDNKSISIKQEDLHKLEYHATVSHKTPVFAVQFLNTNEVWLMMKQDDLGAVKNGIEHGKDLQLGDTPMIDVTLTIFNKYMTAKEESERINKEKIKSKPKARDEYNKKEAEKWTKKEKKA